MPFVSFDFLVSVKADVRPLRRRLDALTIGTARGGFGETPLALAFPLAQRVHNALPYPRQPPAAKVAIDRVSIADIRGHPPPLAPSLVDVANAIEHAAEVQGFPPRVSA